MTPHMNKPFKGFFARKIEELYETPFGNNNKGEGTLCVGTS